MRSGRRLNKVICVATLLLLTFCLLTALASAEELKATKFVEDWGGVKFELTVTTNATWEVGGVAEVEVSVNVTDMGGNRKVEFRQLKLTLFGSGIERTEPLQVVVEDVGVAFVKRLNITVLDAFGLITPGTSSSYHLWVDLEGSVVDKYGYTWPYSTYESLSVMVYATPAPVSLKADIPSKITVGEKFNVTIKVKNEGKYPVTNVELKLHTPLWTSVLGPNTWVKERLEPGEEASVTFKLNATNVGYSSVNVGLSYVTIGGYYVTRLVEKLKSFTISKIPTAITIAVEVTEVDVGGTVLLKGSISPPLSVPVTLTVKRPDGSTEVKYGFSGADGSFSFEVKLDREGKWTFIASWEGDLLHEASTSKPITIEAKPKRCLVATAAYGTELAGPVAFLRSFRDDIVMKTRAGKCFMESFNAWYYAWAPYVAQAEWSCEPLRQAVRYALYPLIGVLHAASAAYQPLSFSPEAGVIVAGLVASALIAIVYLTPITIASALLTRRAPSPKATKLATATWSASLIATCLGGMAKASSALLISTPALVLSTMALTSILITKLAAKR